MTDRERPRAGSLPSSGLAHEILGRLRGRAGAAVDDEPQAGAAAAAAESSAVLAFADTLDREAADAEPPRDERTWQLVTFWVCGAEYALPIERVQQILRVGTITRVPQAPPHIRGVTNVRGRVLPVVELSTRLGGDAVAVTEEARVVTVEIHGRVLGLLVDRASSVVALPEAAIDPPPDDVLGADSDYIVGVGRHGRRVLILLDLERVLSPDRRTL